MRRRSVIALCVIVGIAFWCSTAARGESPEIPKALITATSSSVQGAWFPARAIDGNPYTHFKAGGGSSVANPQWLRLDLGTQYLVDTLGYLPRSTTACIKDYAIYVTNSDSTDRTTWGTPIVTDTLTGPSPVARVNITFTPTAGRYLIFESYSNYSDYMQAMEVWVQGTHVGPLVTAFTINDTSTMDPSFTNAADVVLTIAAEAGQNPIDAYAVTTTSTPPAVDDAAWITAAPNAWTLEAEGTTTLWAWAKDSANVISPAKPASILYSTAAPAVSNVIARGTTDGTVAICWDTDVPAVGIVNYSVNGGGW